MTRLGAGYRPLEVIRRCGSTSVYDAWSPRHLCRCVVKVATARASPAERDALLAEGRLLLSLSHPHIVRALEVVEEPRPAIVLEPLPGVTLSRLLRRGPLRARDVAMLAVHLCSALHYLHGRGFLHLDLKPSNIVCHGGIARLIDLGIARPPGRGDAGVGSADYLAPEQARGEMLGPATDVFGLGAVLFHAATGRPAFDSDADGDRYEQLVRRAAPVASVGRVMPALARIIDACLEPVPELRPKVGRLSTDLRRVALGRAAVPRNVSPRRATRSHPM